MERISKLEDTMGQVREDLAEIKATLPHLSTKADVEKMGRSIVMWNVGTLLAVAGIIFAIVRYFG
jgi:hypothetical protein